MTEWVGCKEAKGGESSPRVGLVATIAINPPHTLSNAGPVGTGRGAGPDGGVPAPLRRPLSQLALPQVLGLILNLPSPVSLGLLSLPLRRRHWVALRQVGGVYYNLDSKLRAPEVLGNEDSVR